MRKLKTSSDSASLNSLLQKLSDGNALSGLEVRCSVMVLIRHLVTRRGAEVIVDQIKQDLVSSITQIIEPQAVRVVIDFGEAVGPGDFHKDPSLGNLAEACDNRQYLQFNSNQSEILEETKKFLDKLHNHERRAVEAQAEEI